jgi:multiple sugar transport system permease protein
VPPEEPISNMVTSVHPGRAPNPPAAEEQGQASRHRRQRSNRFFVASAMPAVVVVAAIILVPLIVSVGLSFTGYNIDIPDKLPFVGLENYRELVSDPQIPGVLLQTLEYVLGAVVAEIVVGVAIAVLLASRFPGIRPLRVIYMLPLMVSWVPVAITWRALLDPQSGWVAATLTATGLPTPASWLGDPHLAMVTLIATDMWVGVPFIAILSLTAILSLPLEPEEAAMVDGASRFQIFRHVTLPGIKPVLVIAVVFRMVDTFRQFALMDLMTGGGPGTRTTVLNYYTYLTTFQYGQVGYGAALAVAMVIIMIIAVTLVFVFGRRR